MEFSFFTTDNKSGYKSTEKWLSKNHPEEYDKIVNDKYSVQELLAITNNDTRAVAYEYFNKEKFASEPHKVLDTQID